ncbi:hypothetical protein LXL04_004767 [Taraxacum kok-saghyz]
MSIKHAISELAVNEWKKEAKKAVNQNCSRWRKIRLCTVPEFLGRWKWRWQWRTDRLSDGDGDGDGDERIQIRTQNVNLDFVHGYHKKLFGSPLVKDEIDGSMERLRVQRSRQKGVFYSPLVKTKTLQYVINTRVDVKRLGLLGESSDVNIGEPQSNGALTRSKKNLTKKSLHGMKQTCKLWYLRFDNFMRRNGFKRRESNQGSYLKKLDSSYIILVLSVDDVLIAGSDMKMINEHMRQLTREFSEVNLRAVKLEKVLGTTNHASECSIPLKD